MVFPSQSYPSQRSNGQFFVHPSELHKGLKDSAPTDLRPMGVSSGRHTFVTQALKT